MMGGSAERVGRTLGFRALHVDVVFFWCFLRGKSFHLLREILIERGVFSGIIEIKHN